MSGWLISNKQSPAQLETVNTPSTQNARFQGTESLEEGIRRLADQTSNDIRAEVDQVLAALAEEYEDLPAVREYVEHFGWSDLRRMIADIWHRRFEQGLKLIYESKTQTRVLCGFGSVVDKVYALDRCSLKVLEEWCHEQNSAQPIDDGNTAQLLHCPQDILSALAHAFQDVGLKPTLATYPLRETVHNHFPLATQKLELGGAPAIIAEVLSQLGVDSRYYAMYHSTAQANVFGKTSKAKWLNFNGEQPIYLPAQEHGQAEHPTRFTYALVYGKEVHIESLHAVADKSDRLLLIARPFINQTKAPSSYVVRAGNRPIFAGKVAGPNEWPSVCGFVRHRPAKNDQNCLEIDFLPKRMLERLAQDHHYVILNGPTLGQLQNPNDALNRAVLRQLRALNGAGTTLHLEISGTVDPKHSLAPFRDSLRGMIRSIGINHKELAALAPLLTQENNRPEAGVDSSQLDVYSRYQHARRLAELLDLERIYVHGNDVDLVLRRGASEAALQQEIHADLFTKGAVVVSILLRNGLDLAQSGKVIYRTLYHKGFGALIEFAGRFAQAQHSHDAQTQRRHLQQYVSDGYFLAPERSDYSVAVIPVMWPEVVRSKANINTTGAGDICSGLSLVYSGWR